VTSIVGVLCQDGAVIGTDSAATLGPSLHFRTIEQPTEKISVIGAFIIAGTGAVGLDQRFCEIIHKAWRDSLLGRHDLTPVAIGKHLSLSGLEDFSQTRLPPGQYGALVAFPFKDRPNLCELSISDFQPELRDDRLWYGSMGSAQLITDPFLALMRKAFWEAGPPLVADAVFAVFWALEHAIAVNPGGVNGPPQIAVLQKVANGWQPRILDKQEFDEHRQNVEGAYEALREYRRGQRPSDNPPAHEIPAPPQPD
jgi:hypothetical protein